MPKSLFCLVVFLLSGGTAAAQYPDDEYYPYAEREERRELLVTDSTLFYRAVQSAADLYGEQTDFNLPQVAFKRRGLERRAGRISFAGMDLSYRYLPALRLLGAEEIRYAGLVPPPGESGGTGGVRLVGFSAGEPLQPFLASVRLTDRNYLAGAKVAASAHLGRGWRASLALDARTGRDMHVEGVFTNALTVGLRLFRRFGGEHALSLVCIVPPSVRGTRLSSSEEAFTLTGDRLYNPAWGYQDGRVRNSRVRRETLPLLVADYAVPLSEAASLSLRLGAEAGVARYSMLDWYDARTPMPDNYRYLPSYTDDLETERAWLTRDPRYTQIDWDELIRRNRMQGGHAVYALDDRVERPVRLCLDAAFSVRTDSRLTLRCGVSLRSDRTRFYRQMRDLLGAGYVTDIDRYLVDDDTYSNLLQNDLRHPDRTIREGDRFGYDYAIRSREIRARFCAEYRSDRFRFDLCAELGAAAVRRRGFYEKELFPGALSYGPSRTVRFAPWRLKALAGWSFSPRSYLEAAVMAGAEPPLSEALFYQPSYNNRIVDDPSPERTFAAEASWRRTGAFARHAHYGLRRRRVRRSGDTALLRRSGGALLRHVRCGDRPSLPGDRGCRRGAPFLPLEPCAGRFGGPLPPYPRSAPHGPLRRGQHGGSDARRRAYGRLRGGRNAPDRGHGRGFLLRSERVGRPSVGRLCRRTLRRADASPPHGPHRRTGRAHARGVRRLHPSGTPRRRLHARCVVVQNLLFRPFAADRFAAAAQPHGRAGHGLQRLRVVARAAHPFGRRDGVDAPRFAPDVRLAAFVLPYGLLPFLTGG